MRPRVKDWLKWVAAGFALVATASAEYDLARAIGMNEWIAAAVPGALDAYVVRALRAHREVLTSVLAMVGVNAASHLVTAGIMPMDWRLITAVSAIAPLVLWRVHALSTPGEARARVLWTGKLRARTDEHGAESVLDTCPCDSDCGGYLCSGCEHASHNPGECASTPPDNEGWENYKRRRRARTDGHTVNVGPVTSEWDEHMKDVPGLGDYVPAEWSTPREERAQTCSHGCEVWGDLGAHERAHVLAGWDTPSTPPLPVRAPGAHVTDTSEHGPECPCLACPGVPDWVKPPLSIVPPLPAGFEHACLTEADTPFMDKARVLVEEHGHVLSVRTLKDMLNVGTPRAQRVHAALVKEASTDE